nr:MAG TPA: hypothetical protein [Caudoviricetes sp.]
MSLFQSPYSKNEISIVVGLAKRNIFLDTSSN